MNNSDSIEMLGRLAGMFIPFLFALSFHEFAHGWVAQKKGDNTAQLMGRLTLNPFAHADLVGTFILPIMSVLTGWALFGWAKPVPVNVRNLKNPKSDMFWIALAGPLSNLLLAVVGGVLLVALSHLLGNTPTTRAIAEMLAFFIFINMLLCLFNLIPLHPLDGGKILARIIPESWNRALEEHQMTLQVVLIGFFLLGGFQFLAEPPRHMVSFFLRLAA